MRDLQLSTLVFVALFVLSTAAQAQAQLPHAVQVEPQRADGQVAELQKFEATDTLLVGEETRVEARRCLDGLCWTPGNFEVNLSNSSDEQGDLLVRFPSPLPSGQAENDNVAMEWYQAKDAAGLPIVAPAAVVVHESGRGMTVGRLLAKSLRSRGVHTFMLQLPFYGHRGKSSKRPVGQQLGNAMCQGIADVRRAHDAVAVLPYVDPERISLQGTSLGGFVSATAAGMDNAYANVFVFLAGGDLYSVLHNGQKDAAKMRETFLSSGIQDDEFRQMLDRIEPLKLAHRIRPQQMWLFTGKFDSVVPPENSKKLADAVGLPADHRIELYANHYSGIMYLPLLTEKISQLMRK